TSKAEKNRFWIHQLNNHLIFKEGDVISEIDAVCVEIQNLLADKLFDNSEKKHSLLSSLPVWIVNGGFSTEIRISKEDFESFVLKRGNDNQFNKILYFYDFRELISTLQTSVITTRYLFGQFYKIFNESDYIGENKPVNPDGI